MHTTSTETKAVLSQTLTLQRQIMRNILILILGSLLFSAKVRAQIDTEFWFAAPDLIMGSQNEINAGSYRDRPIMLVLSSINEPAQVKIWQPANLSFTPIVVNLAATATVSVNLTPWLAQIETSIPDSIMNTGVLIRSTAPITAYYELGATNNRDIIALKGKNANGTLFYTPFQTLWENARTLGGIPYIPQPRSGFVIVATDDTTNVTITPSIDIKNHPAGVPFTIQLHRGQTYYCEATGPTAAERPAGTKIESDKPVAVTVKDDMIDVDLSNEGGADLSADQLISAEKCGFKHVVVKGQLINNLDRVFVVALYDSTYLYIDGNPVPVDTLMAGEQYVYTFSGPAGFIEGSKEISLLHVSGSGDQIAGAIIPSLECTGSNQIGFTRPGSGEFRLYLTIKDGFQHNFEVNGVPLNGNDFQPVPGSGGRWVFLNRVFSTAEVPTGQASLITNFSAELFHMGTAYRQGASCNYGYFSNFSYLNLGLNRELCLGDSAILDAEPGKTSYLWSTNETTQKIVVKDPGIYMVEVLSGNECYATDTIEVSYYEPPVTIQRSRDTICEGSQLLLTVPGTYLFEWMNQPASVQPFYVVEEAGTYFVQVTDYQGCKARDSVTIYSIPRPPTPTATFLDTDPEVRIDTICAGESITFTMSNVEGAAEYNWIGPGNRLYAGQTVTLNNVALSNAGNYLAFVIGNGCESLYDTLSLFVNPSPEVYIGLNDTICDTEQLLLDAGAGAGYVYEWQDGSTDQTYLVGQNGLYWVKVTNPLGCTTIDSAGIYFSTRPAMPEITIGGDPLDYYAMCSGLPLSMDLPGINNGSYFWIRPAGDTLATGRNGVNFDRTSADNSGIWYAFSMVNGCPSYSDSIELNIAQSPEFQFSYRDSMLCSGDSLILNAFIPGQEYSYRWQNGNRNAQIIARESGRYKVTIRNDIGCETRDSVELLFVPLPLTPQMVGQTYACQGQPLLLSTNPQSGVTFHWSGPGFDGTGESVSIENPVGGGLYRLWAEVQGCSSPDSAELVLTIRPQPVFELGSEIVICKNTTTTLSGPENMQFYAWSNQGTERTTEVGGGQISLTVTDEFGCTYTDVVMVNEQGPVAAFSSSPPAGSLTGTPIQFTDESEGSPVAYLWKFGSADNSSAKNPSYAFMSAGDFKVLLEVTDANGCKDTLSRVYVISNSVTVPNSFTPNGDGFNDLFVIRGIEAYPGSKIKIFNRWGSEVFASDGYSNDWAATDCPDGVYYYVVELSNGENLHGDVTIRRK